jgi:glycerol uptake facilitator protein
MLGTFILIFFGLGVVHAAVLTGAQTGLWQVAIVWGAAVTIAIYVVGGVSGAHINPAITIMLAFTRRFPPLAVLPYIACQLIGATLAAMVVFVMFDPFLREKEDGLYVKRGDPGSVLTAMCYGEYFPAPGGLGDKLGWDDPRTRQGLLEKHFNKVRPSTAFFAEFMGTLLLALVVLAVTDERNRAGPLARLAPAFIGLTIAALISVIAPITQACFNPARDFGPRLFAYWAGWGEVALPGPNGHGFWTVYNVAPIAGAFAGGGLYLAFVRPFLPSTIEPLEEQETDGQESA